jgi:sporulation protein YlmC with PRC-barrel domain
MRLELGRHAHCADGTFGELVDIVVDPLTRRVTHLVVEPHHRHWMARLVPIELAAPRGDEAPEIALACTIAEARALPHVQHEAFLRVGQQFELHDPDWEIGVDGVLMQPYFDAWHEGYTKDAMERAVYDRIPKGEVEIRRASEVTSSDGHGLGHVEGFVVDDEEHITHVLLEHGHLWGKREITIPVRDVDRVRPDAIALRITKDAVGALEPVPVHRRH